jgi:hypothetical protein
MHALGPKGGSLVNNLPDRETTSVGVGTASSLNAVAGLWLILSPFVLHVVETPAVVCNNVIVGAIVLILGLFRAADPERNVGLSWINLLLGIWLIISPFALVAPPVPPALAWNNVILGIIVLVLAALSGMATKSTWRMAQR